jgi:hypothetical protein
MKAYLAIFLVVVLATGCSESTGVEGENSPPSIRFVTAPLAVGKGTTNVFSVEISDKDDDPLVVSWSKSAGTFLSPQGSATITWRAPGTVGVDTLIASVTDQKATSSDTLVFEVGTPWSQDINGYTTRWTKSNSPYILTPSVGDELSVNTSSLLTIDAGVRVYVDFPSMEIVVYGELRIRGTQSEPVIIKPNLRNPPSGFWVGIRGARWLGGGKGGGGGTPGLIDAYWADISYAETNLRADDDIGITLVNSRLTHGGVRGLYFGSSGALVIDGCEIADNKGNGIEVIKFSKSTMPDSLVIRNSAIRYNTGSGIVINLRDSLGTVRTVIEGDSITYNSLHGIKLITQVYPEIHGCAIFFNDILRVNGGHNIHLEPGFNGGLPSIDARCNYWGFAYQPQDSSEIAKTILDSDDRGDITARVLFNPWMNTHPGSCP